MDAPHYSAAEALAMDAWLLSRGFTLEQLMAAAGRRVAEAAAELIAAHDLRRAVFLVGPGNNGGDALVAEGLLREADHLPARAVIEPACAVTEPACAVTEPVRVDTLVVRPLQGDTLPPLDARDLLVDGLFGVGLVRPIEGAARAAVEAVNASPATVLAIDIPSGLSPDSGAIVGVDAAHPDGGVAVRAHRTVSFVGPKAGFFAGRGPELVGAWSAVEIGFPAEQAHAWVRARRAGGTPGA